MPNTDDELTPVAPLAVTEPAPAEGEVVEAPETGEPKADTPPSYRVVSGFGVVFARDLPWPNRGLSERAWDKLRDDLALHGEVEVFEFLPPTEYENDPEGPFLAVAVSGSLIEVPDLTGIIRDLPKYEGSWPTFVMAALDVLRAASPEIAQFINEEPAENLKPARFILVEEVEDDDEAEE